MAVVSISKIQVRQGRKYGDEGIPQLASGEFGWAIDAQELYIGNGSVEDGAPYVGNTRLLTDNDNIFELASDYEYRDGDLQTGLTSDSPVIRSLQDRLDDWVSIRSFGAVGDGTDQTEYIQNALNQLFFLSESGDPITRVVLYFDPGVYTLTNTIDLPPYTTIVGSGIEQTVFETSGDFPAFRTISSETGGTDPTYLTQSRHLTLGGFTVRCETDGFELIDSRDGKFIDIVIERTSPSDQNVGVYLESFGSFSGVGTRRNFFDRITIKNFGKAVYSLTGVYENTWHSCRFENLYTGFDMSTTVDAPVYNVIENSVFSDVQYEGVLIQGGMDNTSRFNKYYSVGTGSQGHGIFVTDHFSNASIDDWFSRLAMSYEAVNSSIVYHRSVDSDAISQSVYTQRVSTAIVPGTNRLIKLPAKGKMGYTIEYIYRSDELEITRSGKIDVSLDTERDTGTPIQDRQNVNMSDDYLVSGPSSDGETLILSAELVDESSDGRVDSLIINMNNSSAADDGEILFRVMSKG